MLLDTAAPRLTRWGAVVTAAIACAAFSLLVLLLPTVPTAVRNPVLHTGVEVTAAWISLSAAALVFGRFRRSRLVGDLWLTGAFMLFGSVNLLLSAIPSVTTSVTGEALQTWGAAVGRASSAAVFAVAALMPDRHLNRRADGRLRGWVWAVPAGAVTWVLAIVLVLAPLADGLPDAVRATALVDASVASIGLAHPALAVLQVVAAAAFAVAAYGFGRRGRTGDAMRHWLAVAAVFAAFSRLHYVLLPSLYADVVYTGDLLRLSFYLLLVLGVAGELGRMWRGAEEGAAAEERARIARELHDGLAQELAFISGQASWLARRNPDERRAVLLASAAQRALDESRRAIEALSGTGPADLPHALTRAVEEVGVRFQQRVAVDITGEAQVPDEVRDHVVRIAREAVSNAARHAQADLVRVRVSTGPPLHLEVHDDGKGFDTDEAERDPLRFGLRSMQSRADALGGLLTMESTMGKGTTVQLEVPWKRR